MKWTRTQEAVIYLLYSLSCDDEQIARAMRELGRPQCTQHHVRSRRVRLGLSDRILEDVEHYPGQVLHEAVHRFKLT